jgi:pyrroloquinoline quinone biosynthesis protein D
MPDPAKRPQMAPHLTPRLAPGVRLQPDRVSGKPALLYPEGVLLLNPTGAAIVELCDGRRTFGEIVGALALHFQAPAEVLSGDVAEYLGRLSDRGLLQPLVEQGAPP